MLLAAASCTAASDGEAVPADTLPPVIWFADGDDAQPPEEGPLYLFADSTREDGDVRWGYADARGKLVIHPRYDGASRFADGRAVVMRGEEFLVIDSMGVVVERLAEGAGADTGTVQLPSPCDSCALSEYARRLPRVGRPVRINVHPIIGERFRRVLVQRHPQGVLSIAEGGWEHWGYELRVPGGTMEQGLALARRVMGGGYVERPDPDEPGAVVLEATEARLAMSGNGVEAMRVRVRDGVLEIRHGGGV